jgi:hypothetical protein
LLGSARSRHRHGLIEDGELIEELYCDEPDRAGGFRAILTRLAAEQGIDPAIREETRQECLVSFRDVNLESNFGFIPQTNTLRFTPTAEVMEKVVNGQW